MDKKIMAGPWITELEIKTVNDMMRNGWYNYYYVEKFEPEFAKYHDRGYGVMTPNCTSAIHLMLLAIGIKEGDEVIVPEITWTGTAAPITYQKAIPVFCDIEPDNWCLDPESVERSITSKTKAIMPVGVYGNMPKMDELIKIAEKNNIPLIEDAGEAIGSKYKEIRAGKFGIGSTFSFHRTKTICTGEGGILLLDDKKHYDRTRFLRDHGRSPTDGYYMLEAAYKYMPSNLQAALAYAQFQRIEELVDKKREFLHMYKERFSDIGDLQFNIESDDVYNGAWATSLVFGKSHSITKKRIMEKLKKMDFPVRPFFYPLSSTPAYSGFKTGDSKKNPVSYDISNRGITLPGAFILTETQIDEYCGGIRKILGK